MIYDGSCYLMLCIYHACARRGTVKIKNNSIMGRCMVLLLECPRCHNRMKYQPAKSGSSGSDVSKKVKKCVYCNFSMSVGKSVVQKT